MLADCTDGIIINKTKDITYKNLYQHVYNKKVVQQSFSAILITGYQPIELEGKLSKYNGIDTDRDTMTDWDEVGVEHWIENGLITYDASGNLMFPTIEQCLRFSELSYVQKGLERFQSKLGVNFGTAIAGVRVLPIKSDPTRKDSDMDGICDKEDENPLHYDIRMYNNVPYYIYYAIKYSELDKKQGASMKLKKLTTTDLLDSYDSEVYTTNYLGYNDYGYCSYNFSYKTEEEMKNLLASEKIEERLLESLQSFLYAQNDLTDVLDGTAEVMGNFDEPIINVIGNIWGIIRGSQDVTVYNHYEYLTYIYKAANGKTPICESVDIYGTSPIDGSWRIERTYKSQYYTW